MKYCAASSSLAQAARLLRHGGVVAYPTEAVWGLGCDPFNPSAVQRILSLKQRPIEKGLIMIAANINQCSQFLDGLSEQMLARLTAATDKPTTWIIPNNGSVPPWICGQHASFALRITKHPYAKALCELAGGAIVSTSANPASKPEARTRIQLMNYFPEGIDVIAPGIIGQQRSPSEIRDLQTGSILRPSL